MSVNASFLRALRARPVTARASSRRRRAAARPRRGRTAVSATGAVRPVALHDRPVGGLAGAGQRAFAPSSRGRPRATARAARRGRAAPGRGWAARATRASAVGSRARCSCRCGARGRRAWARCRRRRRALLEQRDARVLVFDRGQHDPLDLRRAAEVVRVGLHDDPPAGLELLDTYGPVPIGLRLNAAVLMSLPSSAAAGTIPICSLS